MFIFCVSVPNLLVQKFYPFRKAKKTRTLDRPRGLRGLLGVRDGGPAPLGMWNVKKNKKKQGIFLISHEGTADQRILNLRLFFLVLWRSYGGTVNQNILPWADYSWVVEWASSTWVVVVNLDRFSLCLFWRFTSGAGEATSVVFFFSVLY